MAQDSGEELRVKLTADLGNADAAVAQLTNALRTLGATLNKDVTPATREAEAAHGKLWDKMKDLRKEAVGHNRVLNFYGRQLSGLVGETKGLTAAFVGLGAGLASGMWMMAAIEGIKLVVEWTQEAKKEAKKAAEELQKWAEDLAKSFRKIAEDIELAGEKAEIATHRRARAEAGQAYTDAGMKVAKAQKEAAEIREKLKGHGGTDASSEEIAQLEAGVISPEFNLERLRLLKELHGVEKEVTEGRKAMAAADDRLNAADAAYNATSSQIAATRQDRQRKDQAELAGKAIAGIQQETFKAETEQTTRAKKEAEQRAREDLRIRADALMKAQELHAQSLDGEARIIAEWQLKREAVEAQMAKATTDATRAALAAELEAVDEAENARLEKHRETEAKKAEEEKKAAVKRAQEAGAAYWQAYHQNVEEQKRNIESWLSPLSAGFHQLFSGILRGTANVREAFIGMLEGIGQHLMDVLLKKVMDLLAMQLVDFAAAEAAGSAAAAARITQEAAIGGATAAAAAMEFFGFLGPLGIAPALAVGEGFNAAILGAFLPQAAAARGFDVGNEAPITKLHPREMVLPAALADKVRDMATPSAPSVIVNQHISAMDGPSVRRVLKANERELIKVIDEAQRGGRL